MSAGRVLQLVGPSTGGMRAHVRALTDELRARGWVVALAGPIGVLDDLDIVVDVGAMRGLVRGGRALRRAAHDVDLVHAHGLRAGWLAALARPACPVVVTAHNVVLADGGLRRRLEARLPAHVDAVIATSSAVAARLGTACVVPPFGPVPRVRRDRGTVRTGLGIGHAQPLVVTVARLHAQKGLDVLLDAAGELRDLVPDVAVVVVGEGPLGDHLRRRAGSLGVDDIVRFVGAREGAVDEIAAADVVAIPSVWESGPLVATEAVALGRPLVSTPVGFVPDLVASGADVRIVPIGAPSALAAALADALAGVGSAPAGTSRRVLERIAPQCLVPAIEAVYAEVLAR